jgi:hypothetical protein
LVYWYHTYGPGKPAAVHASVFERLERLFALDETTAGCRGTRAPGKPVLCAKEIASHGLVPELQKGNCLETTDWGYRLKEKQTCVVEVGYRSRVAPPKLPPCSADNTDRFFKGMVYKGTLSKSNRWVVRRVAHKIPYPRCVTERVQTSR